MMTSERDPLIEALFTRAEEDLAAEDFAARVMRRIDRSRRRSLAGWGIVGLAAAVGIWVLSGPLLQAVNLSLQVLPASLFQVENELIAQVLAPLNSIAGVGGLAVLGLWTLYRKIFL